MAQAFHVFAYGSNMLSQRLQARTPSARALGVARLPGYRLAWHKAGQDGSGKCDVVADAAPGASVRGVVYAISASDKPALDRAEGLGAGYELQQLTVQCAGRELEVWCYVATHINPALRPFTWYKALVLAGARQWALPAAYVEAMATVAAVADADAARHSHHMALCSAALPIAAPAPLI